MSRRAIKRICFIAAIALGVGNFWIRSKELYFVALLLLGIGCWIENDTWERPK